MMKELLIMQHGHAKSFDNDNEKNGELRDKGKRNAQRIGIWLAQHNLKPELIISAKAEHVNVTAEKACKAAGLNVNIIKLEERLLDNSGQRIFNIIRSCPSAVNTLLIVGYNAPLESVLSKLSKETIPKNKKGKLLLPASLAHFSIDYDWSDISESSTCLPEIVHAKDLPRYFPFPDLNGREKRIRPAYYYNQSSVIPYRIQNGHIQVLIISSSSAKHWVVPKGILDPGLSAQDSAAKEAYEEAGIEGEVAEIEIGHYVYKKWKAPCSVSVFPMKVNRILDQEKWHESHRERRWVSVEEAIKLLHNTDLANIVGRLFGHLGKAVA